MKKTIGLFAASFMILALSNQPLYPEARKEIKLLPPSRTGGMPLMVALNKRQSSRTFSLKKLPDQVLSNLLWAAGGINRPESGKRTAPSAMNKQEIALYAVLEEGVYRYNPAGHSLELVLGRDIRPLTGRQAFVNKAALNLVYVADMSGAAGLTREEKLVYAGADAGFIGQNVYLFCASEGLSTVIRGFIDKEALGHAMKLKSSQEILLAQTVGYPGN